VQEKIMIVHALYNITADLWQVFGWDPGTMIRALWILFAVYWVISALKRKKTKQRESILQRLTYVLPLLLAFLLFSRPEADHGWLGAPFYSQSLAAGWLGVLLTAAGVAIAFWARVHLGTNWSGVVTLKEDHELIRTGPYRTIRHPIYTGILLAVLGSVVALGQVRGVIAFVIIWLSFYIKARREESLLSAEFGSRFVEHQQHTGMFLPRIS
jgi:protein-S-isoprenylcysteine O-methyltransferase Ste14